MSRNILYLVCDKCICHYLQLLILYKTWILIPLLYFMREQLSPTGMYPDFDNMDIDIPIFAEALRRINDNTHVPGVNFHAV